VQFVKAQAPIVITDDGTLTCLNMEQWLNAFCPMVVTDEGMV
jgi:hypothetical protein